MARPAKNETERQRGNGVSVYLNPALRAWLEQHEKETDKGKSALLRELLVKYAKENGFKDEDYMPLFDAEQKDEPKANDVSEIKRSLSDLVVSIERLINNNVKCFSIYV